MSTSPKQVSIKRLFSLVWPHKFLFSVGIVALLIASGINLALPAVVRHFIDTRTFESTALFEFCGVLIALFLLQAIAFYVRTRALSFVGIKVVEEIRVKLFKAILDHEIYFFDTTRVGDLTSRLTTDVQLLQDAASVRISVFIRYLIQVIIGVGLMLWLSLTLGGVLLLIIPFLVGTSIALGKRLRKASRAQQDAISASASLAEESFLGIKSLRSLGIEPFFTDAFRTASRTIAENAKTRIVISGYFQSGVSFLMNIALVGVIAYGIWLVAHNQMTAGSLTAFLLYGVTVAISFAFLATGYTELLQSLGGVERVFELIDSVSAEASTKHGSVSGAQDIEVQDLTFSYPSRSESAVLKGVNLSVPFGKFIGIVGYSGSGKSTVMQLLAGLYKPQQGRILIGGVDLQTLSRKEISSMISIVPQDPWIFGGTLKENLVVGNDVTDDELKAVISLTALDEVVATLPQGLLTPLGPRGVQLSGGQRQRIALGRALLKKSPILLLDEATSALDAETEAKVLSGLEKLKGERTLVVIAHRLSAIQKADMIYLMAQGKVIEQGTHESLVGKESLYRELVKLQALGI